MRTGKADLILTLVLLLAFIVSVPAESVTKRALFESEAQTVSNKTFDATNTYNGGTFNTQTLSTPTLSSPTFTGTQTFSGLTANSALHLNGSKQLTSTALTNGQLLIGSTGSAPSAAALTGTANQVLVTNGAGTITLSTPQNIGTASSPTFAGLTLSGIAASKILTTNGSSVVAALSSAIGVADGGTGTTTTPTNGQLLIGNGTGYSVANLTAGGGIGITNASGGITLAAIERGYLSGLTLSTAGSSSTMSIAAGQATNSAHDGVITLSASLSKTTAGWSVGAGNGCLDTGSIANNTWYHFFVILRTDTGVVDGLCSLSATAPALPASYSKSRRIGAGRTNGSAQWTAFKQLGDTFLWSAPPFDVNDTNPGTSAQSKALTVPTHIQTDALINRMIVTGAGGAVSDYVSSLDQSDQAPNVAASPGLTLYVPASSTGATQLRVRTDTNRAIRTRISFSDASTTTRIATVGWVDRRGRDD